MLRYWRREYPQTRLFNEYGPTETVVGSSVYEVPQTAVAEATNEEAASQETATEENEETERRAESRGVAIGQAITNQRIYILDGDGNPVPEGVDGELYIAGEGLGRGYWKQAGLTAERFIPDPYGEAGGRMYRTGDIGRLNRQGELEYGGRADTQVKVRGYRVELKEVETHVRMYPQVKEAAVALSGEAGAERLVAYVLMEAEAERLTAKKLRRYLRGSLPEYMMPTEAVEVERIPLTGNGKVDYKRLADEAKTKRRRRGGGETAEAGEAGRERTGQENVTAELMKGIWREVLGVEEIEAEDNFFELGGHSLLATQVTSRIRNIWNFDLELNVLFENPTVRQMSEWIDEQKLKIEKRPPLLPRETNGSVEKNPLSYAQHRLWFLEQFNPGIPLYNVQLAIRLQGKLNIEALQKSVNEIIRRHKILRTAFKVENNEPVQIVNEHREIQLKVETIEGENQSQIEEITRTFLTKEIQKGFDLEAGNLFRVVLVRIGEDDHIAYLIMHHIVFDGWSTAIIVKEIGELYRSNVSGIKPDLPELSIQYGDFAFWQRDWLKDEVLEKQLEYWKKQLTGIPHLFEFTDRQTATGCTKH